MTGGMQDWNDAGQEAWGGIQIHNRRDAWLEWCRMAMMVVDVFIVVVVIVVVVNQWTGGNRRCRGHDIFRQNLKFVWALIGYNFLLNHLTWSDNASILEKLATVRQATIFWRWYIFGIFYSSKKKDDIWAKKSAAKDFASCARESLVAWKCCDKAKFGLLRHVL